MKYLFLHGLGQTASSWNRVLETLHHKTDAFCPNLPDFLQGGPCGYTTLYEAFSSYRNHISESINLCGLSLGGILAMQYAIEYPEKVHSLVLIGTQYPMPRRLLRLQNAIFHLMPTRMFVNMGFQKQDFIRLSTSMAGLDFQQGLDRMICPTLVVCGEKDHANKQAALRLKELIPSAETCIIKCAGHEVNLETPETLSKILNTFWKQ